MSQNKQPTRKNGSVPKKPSNSNNNSSNGKGNRSRNQGNMKRNNGGAGNQVSVASNYASGQSGKAPVVKATRDYCNVVHRELLMNISATADPNFDLQAEFPLNPGMPGTFPWLSTVAQNWETYRFKKLRFCYYTRTGSTTVGSIVFCPDYDAADSAPANEQIASTFQDVQEDAPWKNITVPLRPAEMHQPGMRKYIRSGALAANLDIKTYDSGNLFVFTVDSTGAAPWGKLWVEYDVDLFTPQSLSSAPVGIAGGSLNGGGTMSAANPFGTAPVLNPNFSFVTIGGSSIVTFGKTGTYVLASDIEGTTITIGINSTGTATYLGGESTINTGASESTTYGVYNVTSPGQTAILACTAATVTSSSLVIGSMPGGSFP